MNFYLAHYTNFTSLVGLPILVVNVCCAVFFALGLIFLVWFCKVFSLLRALWLVYSILARYSRSTTFHIWDNKLPRYSLRCRGSSKKRRKNIQKKIFGWKIRFCLSMKSCVIVQTHDSACCYVRILLKSWS